MLKLNFTYEPSCLDPRRGSEAVTSTVHFMLYEGLTRMTPQSTHEPGLAKTVDISQNKLVYTFHLRESKWSNGDPVTAYDFEYAWKSMLEPTFPCPNAHLLYPIKNAKEVKLGNIPSSRLGIRALDDLTFEVTLESPCPYFLDLTSFCVFFPVPHKIVKTQAKWGDTLGPDLVTNGPFRLIEWQRNNQLFLEKNPLFWEKGRPKLDRIHVTFVSDVMSAYRMYQKDEIDFLDSIVTTLPTDAIPKLAKEGSLRSKPMGAATFCSYNINLPIFQNKNIRKAFAYAIDRQALVENITQFDEIVATGCLPPVLKRNVITQFFRDNDCKEAQAFLDAGLKELGLTKNDLQSITLSYSNQDPYKKVAQALQQQWKQALGIDVKLEENQFKLLLDRLNRRDYQIALAGYAIQYNDPMAVLDRFKLRQNPKNYSGWEDPRYVQLLDQSAFAETDDERFALLSEAETLITEEMPISCLYFWNTLFIKKDCVKDFYQSPVGSIHLNETYIDE